MRLLYCDESNLNEVDFDFFVYGGIVIDGVRAASLSSNIEQIRLNAGVSPTFVLKFNPGPPNLNHQQFAQLKSGIIQAAVDHGCIFLTSLILHNIATSPEAARLREINRVALHFNYHLRSIDEHGLVLIDQFNDTQANHHLREKFLVGVTGMPYPPFTMRLDRILGLHYAAIGQSHFGSLIDIVIGAFRFAINVHTRNQAGNTATAALLLQQLSPLFLRSPSGLVTENSLFFSPKVITAPPFLGRYERLKRFLAENGVAAAQPITNERLY
jgi:hypothetical protein